MKLYLLVGAAALLLLVPTSSARPDYVTACTDLTPGNCGGLVCYWGDTWQGMCVRDPCGQGVSSCVTCTEICNAPPLADRCDKTNGCWDGHDHCIQILPTLFESTPMCWDDLE